MSTTSNNVHRDKNLNTTAVTRICAIACMCVYWGFAAAPVAAQQASAAQSRNFDSPWSGTLNSPGLQYDVLARTVFEGSLGGSNNFLSNPAILSQPSSSVVENNILGRVLYLTPNGHRYTAKVTTEALILGSWWQINDDWAAGLSVDLTGQSEIEFGKGLTPIQKQTFRGKSTTDARATIARRLGDFTLSGTLGDDQGFVGSAKISWDRLLNDQWRLSAAADVTYSSTARAQELFGVTPGQSGATGILAYTPGSGITGASLGFEAEYRISDRWSAFGLANTELLTSIGKNSPLFGGNGFQASGNNGHYDAGIGVRFSF